MNKAAKGRRREYQAIKQLQSEGFACTRSAASKGLFDIVSIRRSRWGEWIPGDPRNQNGIVRCVQVKCNVKPSRAEILKIKSFPSHGGIISKEVWVYKDGQKEPEIALF